MGDNIETRFILAENVRQVRELRGWTQAEFAERSGVSRPRISEIERATGSTTVDIIDKLAKAAGVTPAALQTPGDFIPASQLTDYLPPDAARFLIAEGGLDYLKVGMKARDFNVSPEILDELLELSKKAQRQMSKKVDN